MDALLLLFRFLLAATFAVAGIAKFTDPTGTRRSMLEFGAPRGMAASLARLLPIAELLCAFALLPARTAVWGAAGTLAMLLVFIAVIGISMARGRRPACHCFGQLDASPIGWATLLRNLILSALAAATVVQGAQPSYVGWFASLGRFDALLLAAAVALVALGAFSIWSFVHLLRQNGRLMLRVEAIEEKLGLRATAPEPGLPIDTPAPVFRLPALDGSMVTLDGLREACDTILLIFTEPGCGACDALLPQIAEWQQSHADRLAFVLVSRGALSENRANAAAHGLRNLLLDSNDETAHAYRAEGTPVAVLIRKGRIASHIASGSAAIQVLVSKALEPPPLSKGEPVPAITLPDLGGAPVAFADLRGRRHLLLFWNPDCGFCQQMLPNILAWERAASVESPRLLVISTGTPEANRALGFQSLVVLDHGFQTGSLFGAPGTPAGVLIDEEGRIASAVGGGEDEFFKLTRETAPASAVN